MGVNYHDSMAIAWVASNSLPILHIPNQNAGMLIEGTHVAIEITGYNYINPSELSIYKSNINTIASACKQFYFPVCLYSDNNHHISQTVAHHRGIDEAIVLSQEETPHACWLKKFWGFISFPFLLIGKYRDQSFTISLCQYNVCRLYLHQ